MGKIMKMPFGKYKGADIEDIPSDYLYWLARNCNNEVIATEADQEYQWREKTGGHFWNDN
uniref:Putative quorum-sensing-regulated virulence factor n=1 Tax=viral metagenome TaxID=1070528 RepID=A0A6M3IKR9_9ZZZZ